MEKLFSFIFSIVDYFTDNWETILKFAFFSLPVIYIILALTGVIEYNPCDPYHNGDEWISDCE